MRKRQTFLLTILSEEDDDASFCGRIKVIASGKTVNFTSLEELRDAIASEMDTGAPYPSFIIERARYEVNKKSS